MDVITLKELLEKASVKMEDIKYIVPHQSNIKILWRYLYDNRESYAGRLFTL